MAGDNHIVTFVVTGHSENNALPGTSARGSVIPVNAKIRSAVVLSTTRGAGEDFRLDATSGLDYVELEIKNGPSLVLHPDNAKALLQAQMSSEDATANGNAGVVVPSTLEWNFLDTQTTARGETRGVLGKVILSAIRVIEGPIVKIIETETVKAIIARFDDSVGGGVFQLSKSAPGCLKGVPPVSSPIAARPNGGPTLVLVHGTFSDTSGSFGKLWSEHPDCVDTLFEHYAGNVYALDHPTLGVSPVRNALMLVDALDVNSRLHLLTHSRGGLVAEVLARVCAQPVISEADEAAFKDDAELLADLKSLASLVRSKSIAIDRIVRVACPARGTLLASGRLDAYLSVLKWALELAQVPVAPELVDLLNGVAQTGLDPGAAPGLAAQVPDSSLIRWLHSPAAPLPGDLRVVSGDIKGDSLTSWLKLLLSDAFFGQTMT
ncbi:alpha/beta fold hydrolase [Paraburkholderia caribensis]|uniref:alpha/beta fold hydrolase n=1 Tax=Paraburkholderia caribensis TaxID=75105 RepID=UPI001D08D90B|nr:alpha/beta hydrolase [Paraburkholderia caribensis]